MKLRDAEKKRQEELTGRGRSGQKDPSADRKLKRQRPRRGNREYTVVSGFFVLIFVSLILYLIYFDAAKSEEFINSPYNTRQDTFADRVVRGKILSADGQVLARTQVEEDGTESRVYPYGRVFSHVVGYDTHGKSGLESDANFLLLSSHSFFLDQLKNEFLGNKNQGDCVVTTLNTALQTAAYDALGERNGAVVAIEPSTGKILAMVSKPDFDPGTLAYDYDSLIAEDGNSSLLNRALSGQYPPGSTFKTVTSLAYYRKYGSFEKYSFLCQGSITKEDHTIRCYNGNVHGQEDFYSAFANSCNSAFADIGVNLGGKLLQDTSEALLFNQKLPLGGAKSSTFTLNAKSGVPLTMQTAIGQGNTLVSPLHMALITCSIANGGRLMKPYMISRIENDSGDVIRKEKPHFYRRLMSENEANLLGKLMEIVVDRGTASSLSGRAYSVAGKTGSAEYNESGESHSWFIGYCNTADPELVVAVIVEGGGTGSEAAVPVAGRIFDAFYANRDSIASPAEEQQQDYTEDEESSDHGGWFDISIEESYGYDQETDPEYSEQETPAEEIPADDDVVLDTEDAQEEPIIEEPESDGTETGWEEESYTEPEENPAEDEIIFEEESWDEEMPDDTEMIEIYQDVPEPEE